jgi:ring-1,2-phenylacetyl-CoA epoxidase subunit PaaE
MHDRLRITVKRIENGIMSRWLIDRAHTGDVLHCEGGATGVFTLPADLGQYDAVWLFAAGIGITPLFALLEELLYRHRTRVVLVYSNHSREATVFYAEICRLAELHPGRLDIAWLWSDTQDLRRARLSKESFPLLLKEFLKDDPARALCYICGPASYMWLLQLLLQDAGVPPQQVRREVFVVDKKVPKRLPTDKSSHQVTIRAGGGSLTFINKYPDSILTSAKAAGISLPYSCEAGQCGSCTAICREGKVWMSYNEVLTEKDLATGRVRTCTGHAVGGGVVLETGEVRRER